MESIRLNITKEPNLCSSKVAKVSILLRLLKKLQLLDSTSSTMRRVSFVIRMCHLGNGPDPLRMVAQATLSILVSNRKLVSVGQLESSKLAILLVWRLVAFWSMLSYKATSGHWKKSASGRWYQKKVEACRLAQANADAPGPAAASFLPTMATVLSNVSWSMFRKTSGPHGPWQDKAGKICSRRLRSEAMGMISKSTCSIRVLCSKGELISRQPGTSSRRRIPTHARTAVSRRPSEPWGTALSIRF